MFALDPDIIARSKGRIEIRSIQNQKLRYMMAIFLLLVSIIWVFGFVTAVKKVRNMSIKKNVSMQVYAMSQSKLS